MDNRLHLESLTRNFTREALIAFLRASCGKFRPEKGDLSWRIENAPFVSDLSKLGAIEFADSRRMVILAGQVEKELTTHSGKQKQYEIARKVLKEDLYDAGIFVFHDETGHFRFSLITAQYTGARREFSSFRRYTYFVSPDLPAHTFLTQIGKADFSSIEKILEAFSVEPVTIEFFREYRRIFEEAEANISLDWAVEKKRLYTQRFFNRLMFLAFLERKGWMNFNGRKDYLRALFADYYENETNKRAANFHKSRLNVLFFRGLNNPRGNQLSEDPEYKIFQNLIGDVPYLNGGLFEEEPDDIDGPTFPDAVSGKILTDLIYYFNFTVTESTPLDVEVAVDPEMLGKIFEELVTGRHESGSYYTPKPVVAFMCREALKGYLKTSMPAESEEALALFVDKNDPAQLRNPELALEALKAVKVCDPACGSGAYLLGMMHELLEQRDCLFAAHVADATKIYDRKLEIIQNNLYGVDLDPFAVSIARLRLWLSLIVDFEGDNPPPLPNLDFKIESGDSLTAPDPSGGLQPDMFRQQQVKEFLQLKNEFMSLHSGSEKKKKLDQQIKELREKIREWAHVGQVSDLSHNAFDWQVDFAEVFAPELAQSTLSGKMAGVVNATKGQMELTVAPKEGGFDIVLANPPYVRQELLGDYKEELKPIYPEVYSGTADLYVYFYARAYQLLKNNGELAFISSNKYFRSGYGKKLRAYLGSKTRLSYLIDFGDAPIFGAIAYPSILVTQKTSPIENKFNALAWKLDEPLEKFSEVILTQTFTMLQTDLTSDGWRIENIASLNLLEKIRAKSKTLNEYVGGRFYRGIVTGLNEAFVIYGETRNRIISESPASEEHIKPFLRGRDVKRWNISYPDLFLLYIGWDFPIKKHPSILRHLKQYEKKLNERPEVKKGVFPWYALSRYASDYWQEFSQPKIIYPNICKQNEFAWDELGYFTNQKAYMSLTVLICTTRSRLMCTRHDRPYMYHA